MRRATVLGVISCVLAGCAGSKADGGSGPASAPSGAWAGLGATLADWSSAHPRGSGTAAEGCTTEGCFGARLTISGQPTYEFTTVQRTPFSNRIYGYEQALPEGTPLSTAKAKVLALLPSDAHTLAFWRFHSVERLFDPAGNSCAIWRLRSHTLGGLLAGHDQVSDPAGDISVILSKTDAYSLPRLDPKSVTNAIVTATAVPRDASC